MTGVGIKITANDREVGDALRRMQRRIENAKPAMDEIAARLEASTKHRFETQIDPDGTPWIPSRRALEEGGQTLTDSARLRDSITRYATNDEAATGTNMIYAPLMHFGGRTKPRVIRPRNKKALFWPGARHPVKAVRHPGSVIPARNIFGASTGDIRAVLRIISNWTVGAA